jgi:aryl-alcohol dehydrogenase-like predicted oxidoreductase
VTAPSRLGLGGSRFGSFNNPAPAADSERLVRAALDLGVTLVDTADIYGQGDSERIIGRALAGRRDAAYVVTKAGQTFAARYRLLRPAKPVLRALLARRRRGTLVSAQRANAMGNDWRPAAIAAALDGSLRRLRTDRVDAFLLHSPPAAIAGDPALADAVARLRDAGKARAIGVSCDDLPALDAALAQPAWTVLELPWAVVVALGDRAATIRARGITILAREVVTQQHPLAPLDAVANALAHPAIDSIVVGTGAIDHLRAMAALTADAAR